MTAALVLALSACAGWNGAKNVYVARRGLEASFRFGWPGSAWRPVRKVEGVQVAWARPEIRGIIEVHGQCEEQGDSSLQQYTDHLRIDWADWEVVQQEPQTLVGRAALRTLVNAKLDGVPMRAEFVLVKKNGCLFDLRLLAEPSAFLDARRDFDAVVAGFGFPI